MANRSYLLSAESIQPVPPDDNILLQAPYHVPLLWLALLNTEDLFSEERTEPEGETYLACGAVVDKQTCLARIDARRASLKTKFADWGDLNYHINLLVSWLIEQPISHGCIDWSEINILKGDEHEQIMKAILELDDSDAGNNSMLVEVSTIIPGTRFVTLEDAKADHYTQEDMFTFFRLLGDGYISRAPWS